MYRGDEKIAVANDRDLGDTLITFDERAIDRAARDRRGFPRDRPAARPRTNQAGICAASKGLRLDRLSSNLTLDRTKG
jgi:hypothetical protein